MLRSHKKSTAVLALLLLAALQLHSVAHFFGHAHATEQPCAVCEVSLHQQGLVASDAPALNVVTLAFTQPAVSITSSLPQFCGFSPSLRAPPKVS